MKNLVILLIGIVVAVVLQQWFTRSNEKENVNEWIYLFNGKDLSGWKANENEGCFKVVHGVIVANGERSHLFYTGEVADANFKNFELNLDIKTHYLANSGVYFHTAHQKEGGLEKGYEVQVNGSHKGAGDYKEVKKGGSLYGVRNTYKALAKDSAWYNLNILVQGKHVTIKMNDMLIVDYTEPDSTSRIGSGTFALQGHDPLSTVHFKNIKVKILDDAGVSTEAVGSPSFAEILKYQKDHFAFIDTHVLADSTFNVDKAIQSFYQTGINLGLVTNSANEVELLSFVKKYNQYPVFVGLQNNNGLLNKIPTDVVNQFDYVIGEVTQFKSKGKKVDVRGGAAIANNELFMNDYVKAIVEQLNTKTIGVWSNPTLLPASLTSDYDKLWTKERMAKVIDAAKQNGVAIGVNNNLKLPGMDFLKLAKEKGCHIALTGVYSETGFAKPDYYFDVIEQCKLTYKDIYIPKNND